jgi:hypothetical protein
MNDRPEFKNPFTLARVVGTSIDPEVYHGQEKKRGDMFYVMSRGQLMTFAHNPRRWLHGYEPSDSDATDWGSLIDFRITDAEHFIERYSIEPQTYWAEGRKKGDPQIQKPWNRNATFCREWKENRPNKIIIKQSEFEESDRAISALKADPQVIDILDHSDKQVMVAADYFDRETGYTIPVKALLDIVPHLDSAYATQLFDLKTSITAAPARWGKTILERSYHVQAAMYLDMYCAATVEDRLEFGHIVQENYPPYEVERMIVSQEFMQFGRDSYLSALRLYCQCLKTGMWPGYAPAPLCLNGWNYIEPVPWQMIQSSRESAPVYKSEMPS